jgi:membrane fusion protein, multidrug efflux system
MSRARRWLVKGGLGVAMVAVGGTAATMALTGSKTAPTTERPPATAPVTRQDLTTTKTVSGQIDYGAQSTIKGQGGILTWMAGVGTTVKRGKPLYKVDELPVIALYGRVPMYRDLTPGDKGVDVQQLEKNLRALGFTGFDVDSEYTTATAWAVKNWQQDLRLPRTGTVERDRVVFVPGAVRIAAQKGKIADPAAGDVLAYTGRAKVATADIDAADQSLAQVGTKATIRLPDSTTVRAKVTAVGTVASTSSTSDDDKTPTVKVTLRLAEQKGLGSLDSAPVDITLTAERHKDVLTVPISALLALTEGGYGVQVVDAEGSRIVTVKTGMFAAGRVEVSASSLKPGLTVGVPS